MVQIIDNEPMTTSLLIAEKFEREHKNILHAIENLETPDGEEDFVRLNFKPISYTDSLNREQPYYLITEIGFSFFALGFTGKKAAGIRIKYIREFIRMRNYIIEQDSYKNKTDNLIKRKYESDEHLAELKNINGSIKELIKKGEDENKQINEKLCEQGVEIKDIKLRLDDMQKKKTPKEKEKNVWYDWISNGVPNNLKGRCPFCKDTIIINLKNKFLKQDGSLDYSVMVNDSNIEWHHVYRNEDRKYFHVLPLCITCHNNMDRCSSTSDKIIKLESLKTRYKGILEELEQFRRGKPKQFMLL
jgi:Rha family phage regulatory protein